MTESTYYYEDINSSKLAIPQIVAGNSRRIKRFNNDNIDHKRKAILNGEPLNVISFEVYGEDYEHNPRGNLIASAKAQNL